MNKSFQVVFSSFFFLVICVFGIFTESCESKQSNPSVKDTDLLSNPIFVGSETCKSCHQEEFEDWKTSDHFLAMQHAHDTTVLGDFNNASFVADGIKSMFFKKGGKFFINTQGEDGKNRDFEVVYTFGHYPLQQYLIAFPGGRLQATRQSWDSRDNKWFHQYPGEQIDVREWVHWTGNGQNWNTMCASCHSTNVQKNYNLEEDTYQTSWKEVSVGCESCHGPGSNHIEFMTSTEKNLGERLENFGFLYGKTADNKLQLNTCAPCHARKTDLSKDLMLTPEILDDLIPQIISSDFYHADGQIKEESFEYSSFVQSKMFHMNVSCSNCHNPHSGKVLAIGNNLCMNCHEPKYNEVSHHFHQVNSEGASCINCHMPVNTYMGNDLRRDHSFRIPRPDQSIQFGTPNTCITCHDGKSNQWAAGQIESWYGEKRAYHFSDDLLPGSLLDGKSESHLLKLFGDTSQPVIARATAVYYLANIGSQNSVLALLKGLKDKEALVRYHALKALVNFPAELWIHEAIPNLSDPVRAVRIAAADMYHSLPKNVIPANALQAFQKADAENKQYLHYQTDFAIGNVMLADFELQDNNHLKAIKYYLRGLQKDSLANYARLNLSVAYSAIGKNQESMQTLKDALRIDSTNDRIYFNLALLHYEMGDTLSALQNFQKAMELEPQNPAIYYNYGLLLRETGKVFEAEKVLLMGFARFPEESTLNYALAFIYLSQNNKGKATPYVQNLKRLESANPQYQSLFRDFGLL